MTIHERVDDAKSAGKRDAQTGRYIPVGGGSRTRLPVADDPRVPRYHGFVGVNASQSEDIFTLPALYAELGGMREVKAGEVSKLAGLVAERRPVVEEEDKDELSI